MANKRIDQLSAISSVASADLFVVSDTTDGTGKQATIPQVRMGLLGSVVQMNSGGTLTSDHAFNIIAVNSSATARTLNLSVQSTAGAGYTIVKLGGATVTIQANTGQYIADSAATGTIVNYKADEVYATVTLQAVTTTQWIVVGAHGTWETS